MRWLTRWRRLASVISTCRRRRSACGAPSTHRTCRKPRNKGERAMYDFTYQKPASLADAAKAIAAAEDGKLMAGGMTLIPTLKQRLARPSDVVDLGKIAELAGIKKDGNAVVIGAMTRHADVAHSDAVKAAIPEIGRAS